MKVTTEPSYVPIIIKLEKLDELRKLVLILAKTQVEQSFAYSLLNELNDAVYQPKRDL
jgi:hypothetical protein